MANNTPKTSQRFYRPDIDGMRALAVIAVLIYHIDNSWLPGGFIGVDVFFVISGFLITGIIKRQIEQGKFSFKNFYIGRFWRLYPALLIVIAATFVAAYYLLPPTEMQRYGGSLISSVFSYSNLFFWAEDGYFDAAAASKPLLHTWSLSVEWQFYLFWPLAIYLTLKLRKTAGVVTIIALSLLSLATAQWFIGNGQAHTAFFWMPTRICEFGLGALLAWTKIEAKDKSIPAEGAVLLGLVLIIAPLWIITTTSPFPGVMAMVPAIGAALIIYAGRGSAIASILRFKPVVFIGLLSYSIYLVHWPIIVFFSYYNVLPVTAEQKIWLLAASVIAGFILHYCIEAPLRAPTGVRSSKGKSAFVTASLTVLVVGTVTPAYNAWQSDGWSWRLPDELKDSYEKVIAQRAEYWESARNKGVFTLDSKDRVFVVGNSHAVDIFYALKESGDLDVLLSQNTSYTCFALGFKNKENNVFDCSANFENILQSENLTTADTVVISEFWQLFINYDDYIKKLKDSIDKIKIANPKAKIIIIGPRAAYKDSVPSKILSHGRLLGADQYLKQFYLYSEEKIKTFDRLLSEFSRANDYNYISTYYLMCTDDVCRVLTDDNEIIYWDENHWTEAGSKYFYTKMVEAGVLDEIFH